MGKFVKIIAPVLFIAIFVVVAKNFVGQNFLVPKVTLTKENLSISFQSYISQVKGVKRLQVAEISSNEVIQRTSEFSLFWDTLKLPSVVVQARIPTVYTYYVDMEKPMSVEYQAEHQGKRVMILMPPLEANLPAIDISGIHYEVKKGSVFRDTRSAFDELRRTVTPFLKQRASQNQVLAQEPAREQIRELAKVWVKQTLNADPDVIEVRFAQEAPSLK